MSTAKIDKPHQNTIIIKIDKLWIRMTHIKISVEYSHMNSHINRSMHIHNKKTATTTKNLKPYKIISIIIWSVIETGVINLINKFVSDSITFNLPMFSNIFFVFFFTLLCCCLVIVIAIPKLIISMIVQNIQFCIRITL